MKLIKIATHPICIYLLTLAPRGPVEAVLTALRDVEKLYGKVISILSIYLAMRAVETVVKAVLYLIYYTSYLCLLYIDFF